MPHNNWDLSWDSTVVIPIIVIYFNFKNLLTQSIFFTTASHATCHLEICMFVCKSYHRQLLWHSLLQEFQLISWYFCFLSKTFCFIISLKRREKPIFKSYNLLKWQSSVVFMNYVVISNIYFSLCVSYQVDGPNTF